MTDKKAKVLAERRLIDESDSVEREKLFKAFRDAMGRIADDLQVGLLIDSWGGELFYAYRKPLPNRAGPIVLDLLIDFHEHWEEVLHFLPEAKNEYARRLFDELDDGLHALAIKVLEPLYKKTGKTYKRKIKILAENSNNPDAPLMKKYVETREFKNGVITLVRTKVQGGNKPPKLSSADLAGLPARYDELFAICKGIKEYHDAARAFYEQTPAVRRHGYNSDKWQETWLSIATRFYPNEPKEFLALFASSYCYAATASKIAYRRLAIETGHGASYLEKLVSKWRKGHPEAKPEKAEEASEIVN